MNKIFNESDITKLANMRMPFGKFKDMRLIDLPEEYLIWYSYKGYPKGDLGNMLKAVYEIKTNGLEYLFAPLKNK